MHYSLLKEMLMSNPAMTAATSGFKEIGANFSVSRLQFPSAGTGSGCIISFVRELQWRFGGCCSIFGVEPLSNQLAWIQYQAAHPKLRNYTMPCKLVSCFPQSSYKIYNRSFPEPSFKIFEESSLPLWFV